MNWTIREATIGDYDALCGLWAQADRIHYTGQPDVFRPASGPARDRRYVEETLANPDSRLWVAAQGSDVVAMAHATIHPPRDLPMLTPLTRIYLHEIVVDERFRGRGIGKALLRHVEDWARSLGISRIELTVWEFNTPARAVYEHQGFRTLNRTMAKDIEP